jgi:glucan biosynthesis protein C
MEYGGNDGPASGDGPVVPVTPAVTEGPAGSERPLRAARRPELDVMRALVVAGLVVFHSAVVFAAGTSWFVKDPRPAIGFTVFLLWGSLWGMPLLFVVSGMGVHHAMRTRSAGAFTRERLARLGVPFLTGLVLLVPPMFYLARLSQPGFSEPYGRFWLSFMNVPAIAGGLLPRGSWASGGAGFDPAHLWFLYVLLVFSLALLPLLGYLAGPRGAPLAGRMAALTGQHPVTVLAAAAVPIMITEAAFGPDVNTGGWERLAYVFPFLYGFVLAGDRRFEAALRRARWPALAGALLATMGLLAWAAALNTRGIRVTAGAAPGWSALQGVAGWSWIVAILGFVASFTARLRRPQGQASSPPPAEHEPRWRRAARYGNEAVLPFYLLHEPVIVAAAYLIIRWHAPAAAKYPALVAISFAATLAIYELAIRRYRPTRFLFGMKPAPASAGDRSSRTSIGSPRHAATPQDRKPAAKKQGRTDSKR